MNLSDPKDLASLLEALLLASGKPMSVERMAELFDEIERPTPSLLRKALDVLDKSCQGRAFELKEVASGYRLQVRERFSPWVGRLWEERPQRYSRALLETLVLFAYRQPITRGEVEDISGVAVNSQIVKTLLEREWVRVVGHRDVPGRPAMFATTKQFLDRICREGGHDGGSEHDPYGHRANEQQAGDHHEDDQTKMGCLTDLEQSKTPNMRPRLMSG